jgi:hypothetical protein
MSEAPEQQPVGRGVHVIDGSQAPEEGRNEGQRARYQGEEREDGGHEQGEGEERQGAYVAPETRVDDVHQEVQDGHQGAHRVEQHHAVEQGAGLQGRIGGEHHGRPAAEHGEHDPQGAHQHHDISQPTHAGSAQSAAEQDAAAEEQTGHLEEEDPEDQHGRTMRADQAVEPLGVADQVHLRPARQGDQEGQGAAESEVEHRGDGVDHDQPLRRAVDRQAGDLAGSPIPARSRPAHGVTSIRPSMM